MSTQTAQNRPRIAVTVPEAAELLSIGASTLYEMVACHQIRHIRIGRAIRIPVKALEEYIEAHSVEEEAA